MTSPTTDDPWNDLRKLLSEDHAGQLRDAIYKAFQLNGDEARITIWLKNRKPRFFEVSAREDAK